MFTFLLGEKKRAEKQKARPWDKYAPGSAEWVNAHFTKSGALRVSREDMLVLMQDANWRRERKKFFQTMRRLVENVEKRSKSI